MIELDFKGLINLISPGNPSPNAGFGCGDNCNGVICGGTCPGGFCGYSQCPVT
ncbi:MAG: hypothetical protein ABIL44_11435 [candidate division WOR-3 bacterium]